MGSSRDRTATLVLGHLAGLRTDALGTLATAWLQQGDVARLRLGPPGLGAVGTLLVRPDHVHHVLVRNARNYQLSSAYEVLEGFLGDGLLTSHGEAWRGHRLLTQPAFTASALSAAAPHFVDAAADAVRRLDGLRGGTVDLAGEMARLTLDGVGRALFGARLVEDAAEVAGALRTVQDFTLRTVYAPVPGALRPRLKDLPTPASARYRAAVRSLDRVVARVVDAGRLRPPGDDLLSLLLRSTSSGAGGDRQVRDEVMTFLLAGHETTASALTWTLGLLSRHPDVRRRVLAELDAVLGGRAVHEADVPALPLLGAVLKESLRLFPPAWTLERRAQARDEVDGHVVPAGSTVVLSPYLTHRHPDVWDDPEGFDPDRWLGTGPDLPRGAYVPFGAGARRCIGGAFAVLEATLMLATLLRSTTIDLAPATALRPVPRITLTAGAGLPASVRRREGVVRPSGDGSRPGARGAVRSG